LDVHIEEILGRKYLSHSGSDYDVDLQQLYDDAAAAIHALQSIKVNSDGLRRGFGETDLWAHRRWQMIHDHCNTAIVMIDRMRKEIHSETIPGMFP
jgi:hypothetical protein